MKRSQLGTADVSKAKRTGYIRRLPLLSHTHHELPAPITALVVQAEVERLGTRQAFPRPFPCLTISARQSQKACASFTCDRGHQNLLLHLH